MAPQFPVCKNYYVSNFYSTLGIFFLKLTKRLEFNMYRTSNVGDGCSVSLSINLNLNVNLSLSVVPDSSGGPCSNTCWGRGDCSIGRNVSCSSNGSYSSSRNGDCSSNGGMLCVRATAPGSLRWSVPRAPCLFKRVRGGCSN